MSEIIATFVAAFFNGRTRGDGMAKQCISSGIRWHRTINVWFLAIIYQFLCGHGLGPDRTLRRPAVARNCLTFLLVENNRWKLGGLGNEANSTKFPNFGSVFGFCIPITTFVNIRNLVWLCHGPNYTDTNHACSYFDHSRMSNRTQQWAGAPKRTRHANVFDRWCVRWKFGKRYSQRTRYSDLC